MTTPDPNFNTTPNNSNPFAAPGSNPTPPPASNQPNFNPSTPPTPQTPSNQGNFSPGYPGNNTGFGSNMSEPSNPFGPGVGGQPGQPGQPGQMGQPGQPQFPGYMPQTGSSNTLALVSVILSGLGLLTFITAPIGAILGHVSLSQIKKTGQSGRGLALGGVIAGWVITVLWVISLVIFTIFIISMLKEVGNMPDLPQDATDQLQICNQMLDSGNASLDEYLECLKKAEKLSNI